MSRTSRKKIPPIIYILVACFLWFGGRNLIDSLVSVISHKGEGNTSEEVVKSTAFSQRFSTGNQLLIAAKATAEKKQGIAAFKQKDYQQAIIYWEQSLQKGIRSINRGRK